MIVKLFTARGDEVDQVQLPDFRIAPEVLLWGMRCFHRDQGFVGSDEPVIGYTECSLHRLITPLDVTVLAEQL